MPKKVAVIDYGAGNIRSVISAFEYLGVDSEVISTADQISRASALVLPGVGAFSAAMKKLNQDDKASAIRNAVLHSGKPFLGICLGMQLIFEAGFEDGETAGLNILKGSVREFRSLPKPPQKVPHIGFNSVIHESGSLLFENIEQNAQFYFLHSYFVGELQEDIMSATCHYGGPFLAALEKDNIFGTQFHPEKSQTNGLRLLANFSQFL